MDVRYCQDCGRQIPASGRCRCRSVRRAASPPYRSRAHCRSCGSFTRWRLVGIENGDRPPVVHWECEGCGSRRYQFGDCNNVETMCATVLEENLRRTGANLDHDEAYARLVLEAWRLYLAWEPDGLTFESYGFGLLRRRAFDIYRSTLGRNGEKPLANPVPLYAEGEGSGPADRLAAPAADVSLLDLVSSFG